VRPGARLDVALIFDKAFTFFSGMNSVALSPGGDLAAVCFHDRELYVYRIVEPPQTSKPRSRARDEEGSLEEYRALMDELNAHWKRVSQAEAPKKKRGADAI
jgi:hypothetical protein